MKNNFKSGLQKALDELENITPLKPFNCGKLCSARCCSGGDNDGMGLFPGEEELLKDCADFEIKNPKATSASLCLSAAANATGAKDRSLAGYSRCSRLHSRAKTGR